MVINLALTMAMREVSGRVNGFCLNRKSSFVMQIYTWMVGVAGGIQRSVGRGI